jgi:hypothetical protein
MASGGGIPAMEQRSGAWLRRPVAAVWRAGLLAGLLFGLVAACSRDAPDAQPVASAVGVAAKPPDDPAALLLPDVMEWVVDPAAAVLAAAADQHAWVGLAPRSDEAWQAVVDAAAELVRTSDLLLRPGVAQGQADWLESAGALREGAQAAAAAARRHDPRGLYLAGQQVRSGCQACHARHAAPLAATSGRP